jgi:hypothetical protein
MSIDFVEIRERGLVNTDTNIHRECQNDQRKNEDINRD